MKQRYLLCQALHRGPDSGVNMIYIIRHGQTEKNKANLLQGRSEHPLNETGIRQAQEAGEWFAEHGIIFDAVYSSPLERAKDTGRIAAGKGSNFWPHIDERLIEMEYGPYEGVDLRTPPPEIIEFFSDFVHNPAPEGMEQLPEVTARVGAFLEEIRERAEAEEILVSTHAIAMKGALEYLTPGSNGAYWSKYIGNCAVYAVPVKDGKFGVPYEIRA